MTLRVAIIGAGRMGRERARAAGLLGAKVVTVCDADLERAKTLAGEFQAESVVADAGDLHWQSVDAVFICTPPGCRGAAEIAAIDAGIPLLVEKPIGLSTHHASRVLEALDRHSVINAVGYMNRYRDSVCRARDLIGTTLPIGVVFHWLATQYRVPWWLNREKSGGPINEQCTHFIDLASVE
jgi:myo-inositol 2-dehydrogenase/D-chiro-inositol 1-dehydrogenase